MPSSIPAAKKGIRTYLRSWEGLRPGDDVVIRSAGVAPEEFADEQITLGNVDTAPRTQAGLASREQRPSMTCWIRIVKSGSDEDAVDAARDRAYELLDAVSAALRADHTAGGTVAPPAQATVGDEALEEGPGDDEGTATRWAQLRFPITWTSHIT